MKRIPLKIQKVMIFCVFNLIIVVSAFFIIEGLSSTILLIQSIEKNRPISGQTHTQYDGQLGWISQTNLYIEDMYGPDIYLKTNAQAFRNAEDFSITIPDGKVRVICSGDSFTFGHGVSNDETWCQQLASMDGRLQTINMGQAGYGIDQAYLWYKRDGIKLEHDLHLFAFITDDFRRMQLDIFGGYYKPLLSVRDHTLIVENVPIPKRALYYTPWFVHNKAAIDELRSVQLLSKIFFETNSQVEAGTKQTDEGRVPEFVGATILEDLQKLNVSKNSILVLVYLPTFDDRRSRQNTEMWRGFINIASQRTGVHFIDLIEDFRQVPAQKQKDMFLPNDHYSVLGNEFVAEALYKKLLALPDVAVRLIGPKQ